MPILYRDVIQNSEEHERLKLGIPTSSNFDKVITPPSEKFPFGNPSSQWEAFAFVLIAERCLQRRIDHYVSPYMERGLLVEADAIAWYEWDTGLKTDKIGFVSNDEKTIGCSPDRLIGDDGLLEIKCPKPNTQIGYLIKGSVGKSYWPQLQGQLYVSGRQWVDIVAYHEELPRTVIRVERDEKYIEKLAGELAHLVRYVDAVMAKIRSTQAVIVESSGSEPVPGMELPPSEPEPPAKRPRGRPKKLAQALAEKLGNATENAAPTGSGEPGQIAADDPGGEIGSGAALQAHPGADPVVGGPASSSGDVSSSEPQDATSAEGAVLPPGCAGSQTTESKYNEAPPEGQPPNEGNADLDKSVGSASPAMGRWECACGKVFDVYSKFAQHRSRSGHRANPAQRVREPAQAAPGVDAPKAGRTGRAGGRPAQDAVRTESDDPETKPREPHMEGDDRAGSSSEDDVRLAAGARSCSGVRGEEDGQTRASAADADGSSAPTPDPPPEKASPKEAPTLPDSPKSTKRSREAGATETWWTIAERKGDYAVRVDPKTSIPVQRDVFMSIVDMAPSPEALATMRNHPANQRTLKGMAHANKLAGDLIRNAFERKEKSFE